MAKRPSESGLLAWRMFLGSYAAVVHHLERELELSHGMPLSWYEVLVRLSEARLGSIRMQELARGVFMSKSGLTQVATRMEAQGLIRREACPSDRRGVNAVITTDGRRALRRAGAVHLRGIERHFTGHLDEADLKGLASAMTRVFEAEAPSGLRIPGRSSREPG